MTMLALPEDEIYKHIRFQKRVKKLLIFKKIKGSPKILWFSLSSLKKRVVGEKAWIHQKKML